VRPECRKKHPYRNNHILPSVLHLLKQYAVFVCTFYQKGAKTQTAENSKGHLNRYETKKQGFFKKKRIKIPHTPNALQHKAPSADAGKY
jgi:hypothetical protein